jgi:Na+/H+ antiporter
MHSSWIVLVPPVVVLGIALLTRNVIISLLTGIACAAAIATHFAPIAALQLAVTRIAESSNLPSIVNGIGSYDHLYTFGFLIILGILIQVMTHTGGITAYTNAISRYVTNKCAAESTSLLVSSSLFIDDVLSGLTAGSIMRPLTDRFFIPRAKLAFLINSMSGPLCLLIPATSWVAFILTTMESSGVNEPFDVYIKAIPYLFYPLFIVISAWFIVRRRISFGLIHAQELQASATGNLFGEKKPIVVHNTESLSNGQPGSILDFIIPLGTFLCTLLACILITGKSILVGGPNNFVNMLQEAQTLWALLMAVIVALTVTIAYCSITSPTLIKNLKPLSIDGFMLVKNSLILLLLAWTLGALLNEDLHTGQYLAETLLGSINVSILPLMFCITAALISASTGSVWGTIAILMPICLPMVATIATTTHVLFPALGALLSGAAIGSHLSPITDAMVIASTSAGCYHIDHVQSQIAYASSAMIGTLVAFSVTGFLMVEHNSAVVITASLASGLITTISILLLRNKQQ